MPNSTGATYQGKSDLVAPYQDVHEGNGNYTSGAWQRARCKSSCVPSVECSPGIRAGYVEQERPYKHMCSNVIAKTTLTPKICEDHYDSEQESPYTPTFSNEIAKTTLSPKICDDHFDSEQESPYKPMYPNVIPKTTLTPKICQDHYDFENTSFSSGGCKGEARGVRDLPLPPKLDDDRERLEIKEDVAPFHRPSVSSRKELAEDLAFDAPKKLWEIMKDQLSKAVNLEPSVFSPGIYPFGENLLYKNFSYEEVKVIGWKLHPKNYYDVIKVYYDTYKMAIKITDDGERNAKRHAFWQISMMQKFGESFAKEIGDAHERGCPGTAEDNRVDALNNKAALDHARDNPGIDPATAANNMWSTGRLYGYGEKKGGSSAH